MMKSTRRQFITAAGYLSAGRALRQIGASSTAKSVNTPVLSIGYEESGNATGFPIMLLHGFPDDVHAWDDVTPPLVKAGYRVLVPYLRGFGSTRFRDPGSPRMAEQAAIGQDVVDLADALRLQRFAVCGFDWGGRAACVVAALWPERVRCLVVANGYTIQDIAASRTPATPEQEHRIWYQYYFHTERGRAGLEANRHDLCKLLWQLWSPNWKFDDATYDRTAVSFNNPDFVAVVIQSYRHRFGYAPGDPAVEPLERRLAAQPKIAAPTIVLQGEGDGVNAAQASATQARFFTGAYQRRLIPVIGHNVPQEAPAATAAAVLELLSARSG